MQRSVFRGDGMTDDLSRQRQAIEAALVRILSRAAIGEERLGALVAACAETALDWARYRDEPAEDPVETAAEVNAGGIPAQVRFVLDICGLEEGERRLMDLAWTPRRAA
jgi:hypothetical protein